MNGSVRKLYLVWKIESLSFERHCLHQRYFVSGADIDENISDVTAIEVQVVVLNEEYLKSLWALIQYKDVILPV